MNDSAKKVSLGCVICFATSLVLGPGMFTVPGIAVALGGVEASLAAWIVTAIAVLPFVFIFMRLQLLRPAAGARDWVREACGPGLAKSVSFLLVGTMALLVPALAYAGGSFLGSLFESGADGVLWISCGSVLFGVLLNVFGRKQVTRLARFAFIAMLVTFLYVLAMNVELIAIALSQVNHSARLGAWPSLSVIWQLSTLVFFAFIGWENLSVPYERMEGGRTTLKRAYGLSYVFIVVLYMLFALVVAGASIRDSKAVGPAGFMLLVQRLPFSWIFVVASIAVILANSGAWIRETLNLFQAAGEDVRSTNRRVMAYAGAIFSLSVFLILMQHYRVITPAFLIRCANQNFVVIYFLSLVAFSRLETRAYRWPVLGLALLSSCFLLSGIRWEFLYPLILVVGGYWHHRRATVMSPRLGHVGN